MVFSCSARADAAAERGLPYGPRIAGTRSCFTRRVAARVGERLLEVRGRRVPIVEVQSLALGRHHDRGGEHVNLEAIRELALQDRVHFVDSYGTEFRQRRLLVCAAHGAAVAGEVED